jgi:hypothetical protein
MYQVAVPPVLQILTSLSAVLDKAEAHCQAAKIAPAVLVQTRLFPDMLPLAKQVQIASDHAKGCAARLAGLEPPAFADSETTLLELKERVAKTIDYLATVTAAQIDGSETRDIRLKVGGNELTFSGQHYLLGFALPNFYFHVTTAYAILRSNGVPLGKRDFLGKLN